MAHEEGELDRVTELFAKKDPEKFKREFDRLFHSQPLVEFSEDVWQKLENTDSLQIKKGSWKLVEEIIKDSRDWKRLRLQMVQGHEIKAPVAVEVGGTLHLMSGNTRLMVARALGITPQVLIVKMRGDYD